MIKANDFRYEDIVENTVHESRYQITSQVYDNFLASYGDFSPLHVDADFARQSGFEGRVMHGCILYGFLSHFVGMVFPGRRSLLLSADLGFNAPSYLGDELSLSARVAQKMDAKRVVLLHVSIRNETRSTTAARGRVQVKIGSE